MGTKGYNVTMLGTRIYRARKAKRKYTLSDLALDVGSSKGYMWELENKGKKPSAELLFRIANALDVSMEYLLTGNNNPEQIDVLVKAAIDLSVVLEGCSPTKHVAKFNTYIALQQALEPFTEGNKCQ